MVFTKSDLLGRLQKAVPPGERECLEKNKEISVSGFNRGVLLEMLEMQTADIPAEGTIEEQDVSGLHTVLEEYLQEHFKDNPEGWKWIILSCMYLAFIAKRPLHPVEVLDIKISDEDGHTIYECPEKSGGKNTACHYCVCKRLSNYEIMKRQMQKQFLKYDQKNMIQKFGLQCDQDYIYIKFVGREYRIGRRDGKVQWSDDEFLYSQEANYNEAMTIYDVLCYSKADCAPSGELVNMQSLSSVQGGSLSVGEGLFQKIEALFDQKDEALARACEKLNGIKAEKGDVAYQISLFDFLPIVIRFWNSDEDFPASLQLFTDKNILQYMHYETVWFAVSHLLERVKEEM